MAEKGLSVHDLPYPAIEINRNRNIVDMNKLAEDIGVAADTYCWDTFGKRASIPAQDRAFYEKHGRIPADGTMCVHCRAEEALSKQEHIIVEEKIGDTLWEIHWIPTGPDTYVHYGIDITKGRNDT